MLGLGIVATIIFAIIGTIGSSMSDSSNRKRAIRAKMDADAEVRSRMSAWTNKLDSLVNLQRNPLGGVMPQTTSTDGTDAVLNASFDWVAWRNITDYASDLLLCLYELINKYCPNTKQYIDGLLEKDEYDISMVRASVAGYCLCLYCIASGVKPTSAKLDVFLKNSSLSVQERKTAQEVYKHTLAEWNKEAQEGADLISISLGTSVYLKLLQGVCNIEQSAIKKNTGIRVELLGSLINTVMADFATDIIKDLRRRNKEAILRGQAKYGRNVGGIFSGGTLKDGN